MRVVLDTNVLLSATVWRGSVASKLLYKLLQLQANIFCSNEIIREYKRVLKRDLDYSDEEVFELLEKVFSFVSLVYPKEKVSIVKESPADDRIIECALASKSDYLVTYDKELLKVVKYKSVKIVRPEELLRG